MGRLPGSGLEYAWNERYWEEFGNGGSFKFDEDHGKDNRNLMKISFGDWEQL